MLVKKEILYSDTVSLAHAFLTFYFLLLLLSRNPLNSVYLTIFPAPYNSKYIPLCSPILDILQWPWTKNGSSLFKKEMACSYMASFYNNFLPIPSLPLPLHLTLLLWNQIRMKDASWHRTFYSFIWNRNGRRDKKVVWHRSGVSNVGFIFSVAPYCDLESMKLHAKTENFIREDLSILGIELYTNIFFSNIMSWIEPLFQKGVRVKILVFWNVTSYSLVGTVRIPEEPVASIIRSCTRITEAAGFSDMSLYFYHTTWRRRRWDSCPLWPQT
jgi:hypothetical protein